LLRVLFVNAVDTSSEIENRYQPLWPAYLAAYAEQKLVTNHTSFRFATNKLSAELHSFSPHIVAIGGVSQNFNRALDYYSFALFANRGSRVERGRVIFVVFSRFP